MSIVNQTNNATLIQCEFQPIRLEIFYVQLSIGVFGVLGNGTIFICLLCVFKTLTARMTERLTVFSVAALLCVHTMWCIANVSWCIIRRLSVTRYNQAMSIYDNISWRTNSVFQVASNYIFVFVAFARYVSLCHPLRVQYLLQRKAFVAIVSTISGLYFVITVTYCALVEYEAKDCDRNGEVIKGEVRRKINVNGQVSFYLVKGVLFDVMPCVAGTVFFMLSARELKSIFTRRRKEMGSINSQFVLLHVLIALMFILLNCLPSLCIFIVLTLYNLKQFDEALNFKFNSAAWLVLCIYFSMTWLAILGSLPCLRHQIVYFLETKLSSKSKTLSPHGSSVEYCDSMRYLDAEKADMSLQTLHDM